VCVFYSLDVVDLQDFIIKLAKTGVMSDRNVMRLVPAWANAILAEAGITTLRRKVQHQKGALRLTKLNNYN
jgi:hypothetical protein